MKKVSVIGAGFAGLTVALRLAQKGFEVDLYESSSRVGGLLGTDVTDYGIAERAANALICTEKAVGLFKELGITPVTPLQTSKKRFLFRETPRAWPLSFVETVGFLGRLLPRALGGKKNLKPRDNETLQTWGLRNIGPHATQYILGPAMQGIYGNEISGLSAGLILGPIFSKKKKDKYKGLLTGPYGMQDLVDHLLAKLKELNVNVRLNSSVDPKTLSGPLVVATSAQAAANLLKASHPDTSELLKRIRMSSLMSVTLFFSKPQTSYQGFGCLIPRGYGLKSLGVLMNSYIFKGRDKTYNETWILGGVEEEALLDLSDSEILTLIAEERHRILGHKESLLDYRINRWKNALPYYDLQLEETLRKLNREASKDLYLHGNYLGGIGLSKILERSDMLAEEIANQHG
ncbi:protoporphyrinogen/coproporphyrinogen oxidase [uncultured Bdellovibrio sp.]|uniref:protoporphyrinogen/coproporphyrinogen oxidase n=1 Tax=Bdellovibrio sp. HCB-162 TaxID=3394234 RepID=UPI0025D0CB39|nr:FAD-dependent oxidoreductase [uncultured Bdellovibrio sp.]